jgi:hypothetical protein
MRFQGTKCLYLGICVFEALRFEALLDEQSCLGVFSLEVLKV